MSLDKPKILAIDDEPTMLEFLCQTLPDWGFEVAVAENGQSGLERCAEEEFDLVLVDLAMPEMSGIDVVRQLRAHNPEACAIVMTGYISIESAVDAMKAGAVDYLTKPFELDHLEIVINKALANRRQAEKLHLLEEQVAREGSFEGLVGVSQDMQRVYSLIRQLAEADATVLIQGETGTGKELVARAIHRRSHRREGGFIAINCGALPETLLESELFGHEKGAFTGAARQKAGLVEQASGGTLFLDEIEEMSPALQVKLLRTTQNREVRRVGGKNPIPVDFRLLAATNVNLRTKMEEGTFRKDLFYRLSVVEMNLPPLRARRNDIPLLVKHFLARFAEKNRRPAQEISPEVMMLLKAYSWPGNVRELENVIEQSVLLCTREVVSVRDLPEQIVASVSAGEYDEAQEEEHYGHLTLREARERFERQYLEEILVQAGGVVAEAARKAGIQRQHFYKKMKHYGIPWK
jgi:DNA-binding NtrC family response regulator